MNANERESDNDRFVQCGGGTVWVALSLGGTVKLSGLSVVIHVRSDEPLVPV